MTVRPLSDADELGVLAVGQNAAWPTPIAWDHSTWVTLFKRPENTSFVDEVGPNNLKVIDGFIATTLRTLSEVDPLTDIASTTVYLRLVTFGVSASLAAKDRKVAAALLFRTALQAAQAQGATQAYLGLNPGEFADALAAVGITGTTRTVRYGLDNDEVVLDISGPISDLVTKLGNVK